MYRTHTAIMGQKVVKRLASEAEEWLGSKGISSQRKRNESDKTGAEMDTVKARKLSGRGGGREVREVVGSCFQYQ